MHFITTGVQDCQSLICEAVLMSTFLASLIDSMQLNTWQDIRKCVNMLLNLLDLFLTCQGNVVVPPGN